MPKSAKPKATPKATRPKPRRRIRSDAGRASNAGRAKRVIAIAKRPLRKRVTPNKVQAAGIAEKPATRRRKRVAVTVTPRAAVRALGRPTKLTPDVWEAICKGVEGGMSPSRSAILAGVSPKTLSDWRSENPEFSDAIDQAKARGIQTRVSNIDGAITREGTKDWRAQAWLLSKAAPEEFGDKVEHEHRGTVTLQVPAEQLRRIQARRREQLEKLAAKGK